MSVMLPFGDSFVINTTLRDKQYEPRISPLPGGGVAVAFQSFDYIHTGLVNLGRLVYIGQDGAPIGPDTVILNNPDLYLSPWVGAFPDGTSLICFSAPGVDGNGVGVAAMFADKNGTVDTTVYVVNTTVEGNQIMGIDWGDMLQLADGGVLVMWRTVDFSQPRDPWTGRIVYSDGHVSGDDFPIVTVEDQNAGYPDLVALPGGGFFMAFSKGGFANGDSEMFGQFFDGSGHRVGDSIQISKGNPKFQSLPEISAFPDGRILVSWQDVSRIYETRARIVNPDGTFAGPSFAIPRYAPFPPQVTALPSGNILVLGQIDFQLYGYLMGPDGHLIGSRFLISPQPEAAPFKDVIEHPQVTILEDGRVFIAWHDTGPPSPGDGNVGCVRGVFLVEYEESFGTTDRDTMQGGDGNDALYGGAGGDLLIGGNGNDALVGKGGADEMRGGAGEDMFVVDNIGDRVVEAADEGFDLVQSRIDFRLPENVESLMLMGTAISGWGNTGNNRLQGNELGNTLSGDAGRDTLWGGGGNDSLSGDSGDDWLNGDNGNDTLSGGTGNDTLYGDIFRESIQIGVGGSDVLFGGNGHDVLHGGGDSDLLYGGNGNDTLISYDFQDSMFGGAGADHFVFTVRNVEIVLDVFPGLHLDAHVQDFVARQGDVIDLSAIDAYDRTERNEAFTFIGRQAFHLHGGELRYANGVLEGDVTGDGVADFRIELIGAPRLGPDQLIL